MQITRFATKAAECDDLLSFGCIDFVIHSWTEYEILTQNDQTRLGTVLFATDPPDYPLDAEGPFFDPVNGVTASTEQTEDINSFIGFLELYREQHRLHDIEKIVKQIQNQPALA